MKQNGLMLCVVLSLCSSEACLAQVPTELRSSSKLEEDAGRKDSWTYRNPKAVISRYKSFIIQPTAVYADPAASWDGVPPDKRQKFAQMLASALREEIGKTYTVVNTPGAGVAVMRLTLLGLEDTTPGAATVSRVTPFGLALNGVKSLTGKPGSFTGSVQVAFELTDSQSNELLFAAVRRRSPDALNISATLSTEETVHAVAEDIAESIRKGLDKAHGR